MTYREELLELIERNRQNWRANAACDGADDALFFPEKGKTSREAKRICSGCEVRTECLAYALESGQKFGIWGGVSETERRKIRRKLQEEIT